MAISYNSGIVDGTSSSSFITNTATKLGTLGDGTLRFIPTLWSSKINKRFYATTVFSEIANNDYAGEITGLGDKVIIMNSPTITIADYKIGDTISYERPAIPVTEMNIDRAKSFAYGVNDVEKYQTKADYMAEFADAAAMQLKVAIDSDVLTSVYNEPWSYNKGMTAGYKSGQIDLGAASGTNGIDGLKIVAGSTSTDTGVKSVNAFDFITRLSAVLDEANIPEEGRWLLVPPLFRTKLAQTTQATALIQGGDESMYRNGKFGMIDRWTLYSTNQLKTATVGTGHLTYVLAGHKSALCFASQISKVEDMRNPYDFGSMIRGLSVYGFKVVKPEAMAAAVVYF